MFLFLAMFGSLVVPVGTVSAHAIVEEVVPADGSVLQEAPESIIVTFSEPMRPDDLTVDVKASGDQPPPIASAAIDPADARRVVITMQEVGTGTYQVRLEARDGEDLHQVVARTSFALGEAAPAPSRPISASLEPFETAARWIVAGGLGLLIGVVAVRRRLGTTIRDPWTGSLFDRRLRALIHVGSGVVLVGRIGILTARALSLGGGDTLDNIGTVLATGDARLSIVVLISVAGILIIERRGAVAWLDLPVRRAGRVTFGEALIVSALAEMVILSSWGAHSELGGGVSPVVLAAKSAHLVGLGLWVGVLVVVLVASASPRERNAHLAMMSRVAIGGAVVATVSGLLLASRLIASFTALLSSPYGLMLVAKLVVIALAVIVGIGVHRAGPANPSSRWRIREALLLATVMVFGASMATATPAVDQSFLRIDRPASALSTAVDADDLLVTVRAIPNRPGTNTLEIRIGETRRPSPGAVTGVEVRVGATTYTAARIAGGVAFVDDVELAAGTSTIEFVAHRIGIADSLAELTNDAEVPRYVEPTRISSAPLRTPLTVIALVIAVLSAALLLQPPRPSMRDRRARRSRGQTLLSRRVG